MLRGMSPDRRSPRLELLAAAAAGLAALPVAGLLQLSIGHLLRAAGADLDAVHLLLAPAGGLAGYLGGIALFRLLAFLAAAAAATAWSWRRWSARSGLVTAATAVVAGSVAVAAAVGSGSATAERARRSHAEARQRIEGSLRLADVEATLEDTIAPGRYSRLVLTLPVVVERAGSYRFHLELTPADRPDPAVSSRAFPLDTVLELDRGRGRVPLAVEARRLEERRGMLWWWRPDGATDVEVTVSLLLDREEIERLYGVDLEAGIERLRSEGARPGDLEALRPPRGGAVGKFVLRDTFRVRGVPAVRTTAP